MGVRKLLPLLALVSLLAPAAAGASHHGTGETLTFRIFQTATIRTPGPPAGDAGDVFTTTLILYNTADQVGRKTGANVGNMKFSYTLQGACSTSGSGCKGTADITTVSKLPGGTITASSPKVPLSKTPYVVTVTGGTGSWKGVKGTIQVAPAGDALNIYKLVLP
jgi:hypothetical protein